MRLNTVFGLATASLVSATLATAQDAPEKQPAPDYFIETIVATTTAQNVAMACPTLSFELLLASRVSGEVMALLAEAGFEASNLEQTMEDPSEEIRAQQSAFLEKHGLQRDGAAFEDVCAAGMKEIEDGTRIGSFLVEITGDGAVDPTRDDSSETSQN